MMLTPGARLGPYEIQSALGAGGMGEVYKARDTRLDRTVAIKVLPDALAADPQFRERFDREARAISQLDHPHICALYDVGDENGTSYLVMQYLDGQTLADRLAHGPLAPADALTIAIEIASALDSAHRAGIVHRDLKPGNIFLTKAGAKVLDFGLAKAAVPALAGAAVSMLPTTPPGLTMQGAILGTFQYMAPEQLEGQEADARTDIFAFGGVLYEMLTGRKAFEGTSHASLIGAIMHAEPAPVSALQPLVSRSIDRIVRKCLAKDPDDRWQSARDLLDELKWIAEAGEQTAAAVRTAPSRVPRWRRGVTHATTALAGALMVSALWLAMWPGVSAPGVTRLTITPPSTAPLSIDGFVRDLAITPDGSRVVYVGANGSRLFVRTLDALDPVEIFNGSPRGPFISPDGHWVGFVDNNATLKKVAITARRSRLRARSSPAGRPGHPMTR